MKKIIICSAIIGVHLALSGCSKTDVREASSTSSSIANKRVRNEGPGMVVAAAPYEPSTVAVGHFRQVYPSMSQVLGIPPSSNCEGNNLLVKGNYAKYGDPKEVSATENLAVVVSAFCACTDLVTQESSASVKRYFASVMGGTTGQNAAGRYPASSLLNEPFSLLAKSVWKRDATPEDKTDLTQMLSTVGLGGDLDTNQRNKALTMICGVVLSDIYAHIN